MKNNYKILLILVVIIFALFISIYANNQKRGGVIFLRNGEYIVYEHFIVKQPWVAEIDSIYGNRKMSITKHLFSNLRSIIFLANDKSYNPIDRLEWGDVIVEYKGGNKNIFNRCGINNFGGQLGFYAIDPITEEDTDQSIGIEEISYIVIGDKHPQIKRNPKTKDVYPSYYNYDPYSGEILVADQL